MTNKGAKWKSQDTNSDVWIYPERNMILSMLRSFTALNYHIGLMVALQWKVRASSKPNIFYLLGTQMVVPIYIPILLFIVEIFHLSSQQWLQHDQKHPNSEYQWVTVDCAVFSPNNFSVWQHFLVLGELQLDGEGNFGSGESWWIVPHIESYSTTWKERTEDAQRRTQT